MKANKSLNQAEDLIHLGNLFHSQKKYEEATYEYQKALAINPKSFIAWNNLGTSLFSLEKYDKAKEAYSKALARNPKFIDSILSLGIIYKMRGQFDEAAQMFTRVVKINPSLFEPYYLLADIKRDTHHYQASLTYYKKAISVNPNHARAWGNLATVYKFLGKLQLAKKALKKAIDIDPTLPHLLFNLAMIYEEEGKMKKAKDLLDRGISLNPDFKDAHIRSYMIKRKICDWSGLDKLEKNLDEKKLDGPFLSILRDENPANNLLVAKSFSQNLESKIPKRLFNFDKYEVRIKPKIKIGYLSRDFRDHPIGQLMANMFNHHNRNQFEVWAYSYGTGDDSSYRKEIILGVDHFIDLSDINDLAAAKRIYSDQIDILIDLTGHTNENRMMIMALRPAPVQVAWSGFLGTWGASFIDYILVDKIVVPPTQSSLYSEKLLFLPRCYQVNNNNLAVSSKKFTRADFGLPEDKFVFACFHQPQKIEPTLWQIWMDILTKVPDSVFWLWSKNPEVADNLKLEAKKAGVNPERLIFFNTLPLSQHLKRASLADLMLDTFIYQGANTLACTLWAGVPVLTKIGSHFASRVSASYLSHTYLPELICDTPAKYQSQAIFLAQNTNILKKIREKITHRKLSKNLFDTRSFVKDLEKAYVKIVKI